MQHDTAYQALGLAPDANQVDITQAYQAKLSDITAKKEKAPTPALEAKFEKMLEKLALAYQVLQQVQDTQESQASQASQASQETQIKQDNIQDTNEITKEEPNSMSDDTHSATSANSKNPSNPLSQTKLADLPGMAVQDVAQLELQAGQVIAGRYEIKELIGQGGMGAVYRAFDKNRDEDIAIKVLLPSLTKNENALNRFLNEARVSSKLSHRNIVNVYDVQSTTQTDGSNGMYFLTMELLEGQDLRQIMDNQKTAGRPFDIEDVKEYLQGISEGLAYAHEFTVHRDIKPENIWVTDNQEIKVMDFGIAQLQSTTQRTQTGAAMGTAYYMAPEQLKGVKDIDGRADEYALAVLAYEMLTEEVPAGVIEPIGDIRKDIPKGIANAITQAMSARPENRFEDVASFNAAIQSGKGAKKAKKSRSSQQSQNGLQTQGPNKLVIAAVVLVAVLGLGFAGSQGHLDFLKPIDKELIAQQKTKAAKIQGEIKTLKRRFDALARDLDSDVRDAERNNTNNKENLIAWQNLVKSNLINGERYGEYQGIESAAELLLREEQPQPAILQLTQAKAGYQSLISDFKAGQSLVVKAKESSKLRSEFKQRAQATTWQIVVPIEENYQQARTLMLDTHYQQAELAHQQAIAHFKALIVASNNIAQSKKQLASAQSNWRKVAKAKGLKDVPEIQSLQAEEQKQLNTLKNPKTLEEASSSAQALVSQITQYKDLTQSVNNLSAAQRQAGSAQQAYRKLLKGYPIDENKTPSNLLSKATKALSNKQWVAAGKGFSEAKRGFESASVKVKKLRTQINNVHQQQKRLAAVKKKIASLAKEFKPDEKLTNDALAQEQAGDNSLAKRDWLKALAHYKTAHNIQYEAAKRKQISSPLVNIPAGSFNMGSNNGDRSEKPVHRVSIKAFKMQAHEVTWNQYQPCIDEGICHNNGNGGDEGWGKGDRPVIYVSWNDIQIYIKWLNQQGIGTFRLPSEAEWEYAARAGTTTKYSWGNSASTSKANYRDSGYKKTRPVKSYSPNQFGLYDMHGNVWEWVQDCWNGNYNGAPSNGSAWKQGECNKRVLRGGSWFTNAGNLRSAYRHRSDSSNRYFIYGFRLVQD